MTMRPWFARFVARLYKTLGRVVTLASLVAALLGFCWWLFSLWGAPHNNNRYTFLVGGVGKSSTHRFAVWSLPARGVETVLKQKSLFSKNQGF